MKGEMYIYFGLRISYWSTDDGDKNGEWKGGI